MDLDASLISLEKRVAALFKHAPMLDAIAKQGTPAAAAAPAEAPSGFSAVIDEAKSILAQLTDAPGLFAKLKADIEAEWATIKGDAEVAIEQVKTEIEGQFAQIKADAEAAMGEFVGAKTAFNDLTAKLNAFVEQLEHDAAAAEQGTAQPVAPAPAAADPNAPAPA